MFNTPYFLLEIFIIFYIKEKSHLLYSFGYSLETCAMLFVVV
jgi:hypothetical protein